MALLYTIYQHPVLVYLVLTIVVLWDLIWRALALWTSANNKQKIWFVCLLIFNTLGILPIIYLLINYFKNRKEKRKEKNETKAEIVNITLTKQAEKKEKQSDKKKNLSTKKNLNKVKELVEQQFITEEVTG